MRISDWSSDVCSSDLLRIALELVDVAGLVKGSDFKVFTEWADADGGRVAALRIPGGASLSRKQVDEYAAHAAKFGSTGLAYAKIDEAGAVTSHIAKFFDDAGFANLLQAVGARKIGTAESGGRGSEHGGNVVV